MDAAKLYLLYETDPTPVVRFFVHLVETYGLSSPVHLLDVGCGPGRLLAPLAGLGWRVTGLEPLVPYADSAAAKAAALDGVEVRPGGFADLDDEDTYDLIAAVNGPYSYLLTLEARRDAVQRCVRALAPGGVLFLHFSNFWWILKHYRKPPSRQVEVDGLTVTRTAVHRIDYHAGRFTHVDTFRWTDAEGRERDWTQTHEMAMVTPVETMWLLREAGLMDLRTYNAYEDREPSRLTGKRVMIAARIPA